MTNEQKLQAFKLRLGGATYQAIADMFGCSKQYVYMVLHNKARKQIKCVYPGLKCYIEEHDGNSHRFWLGSGVCNSHNTLNAKLKGERDFNLSEVKQIMEYTGLSFDEAFGGGERVKRDV